MINRVKWGVAGSGGIARRRTIPEGITKADHARLVAVYDIDDRINTEVAVEYGAEPAGTLDELLRSDIDAVYIASPANMHLVQAIACAKAGKHILCEKPLGLTVAEAEKMVEVCRAEGVKLGTGLMMRFMSQHRAALELIENGKLGRPVYARAQLSCWYPPIPGAWRQDPSLGGGGSLMDMGSHCLDLLEMFFGKISGVNCFINNTIQDYRTEDSALVSVIFENGALGTVDTFFCIPDKSSMNSLELYGSAGSIIAKGTIGQGQAGEMTAFLEEKAGLYDARQGREGDEGIFINPEPVNTYRAEIEEFSCAILENRIPSNNYSYGLRNQRLIEACYESARTGRIVYVK